MRTWIIHMALLASPIAVGAAALAYRRVGGDLDTMLVLAAVPLGLSGAASAVFQGVRYATAGWSPGPAPGRTAALTLASWVYLGISVWGEATASGWPCDHHWTLPDGFTFVLLVAWGACYVGGPWLLPRVFYDR